MEIPPTYQFSTKKFFHFQFVGLFFTCFVFIACLVYQSFIPLCIFPVLQLLFYVWMIYKYSKSKTADIPSQCYHPDLLPQSEFLALEQRVDEAENVLFFQELMCKYVLYYLFYRRLTKFSINYILEILQIKKKMNWLRSTKISWMKFILL